MRILGLHASFSHNTHDPTVCLIEKGELQGIYEEERFNRVKISRGHFPLYSLKALLKDNDINIRSIDYIATTGITCPWLKDKIEEVLIHHYGFCPEIKFIHHQIAHMWTALYAGGPNDTNFMCIDAFGDQKSGIYGRRLGNKIEYKFIDLDKSLGNLYAVGTSILGFTPGEDEYKVMGLASYGGNMKDKNQSFYRTGVTNGFLSKFSNEIISKIKTNYQPYFSRNQLMEVNSIFGDVRADFISQTEFAYSIQQNYEECLFKLIKTCTDEFPIEGNALAMAGGCALNCQANLKIQEKGFDVFVSPVSSDRGLALGSAIALNQKLKGDVKKLKGICYGQSLENDDIHKELINNGLINSVKNLDINSIAKELYEGKIVGVCHGRSEAGARALGNRSILASAQKQNMKDELNKKIKYREKFRPFAPAVLDEDGDKLFENYKISRYMTRNMRAKKYAQEVIPACIHVDGTARVQSVINEDGLIFKLLRAYKEISGIGVLINTSFNLKGQPIVQTARDSIGTFFQCGIDILIVNNYLVTKN